ncbi:MAG: TFIIB-type zinc ribbon-containing protein [Candidatus Helarchaeota archaeon]
MSLRKIVYTQRKCPFCGGIIVIDQRQRQMVCSECGIVIQEEDFEQNVIKKKNSETNKPIDDGYPIEKDWNLRQKIKRAFKH